MLFKLIKPLCFSAVLLGLWAWAFRVFYLQTFFARNHRYAVYFCFGALLLIIVSVLIRELLSLRHSAAASVEEEPDDYARQHLVEDAALKKAARLLGLNDEEGSEKDE